jgi:glycosyltransferase involved in cell wall biosynthesis
MLASRSWQLTKPMRQVIGATRSYTDGFATLQSKLSKLSLRELKGRLNNLLEAPEKDEKETKEPLARKRFASFGQAQPLFPETVVMFALVPFDDVGGGQRSAQLARVLTARGFRVVYVYLYKKYNFTTQSFEDSHVDVPRLSHLHIDEVTPFTVLQNVAPGSTAIFEAPHPRYEAFFDTCRRVGLHTVFELIDAWDTSLGGDWYRPEVMTRFVRESDSAVGTARALVESLKTHGRKDPLYLPNAGNEQLFDMTASYERPRDMEAGTRALVYVGSLYGEWFGWEYVSAAAAACPEAIVYLIGDPPKDRVVPSNVRFLGPRPIEEVPAYLAHADATLLPFLPGKISDAVSPIKIFEYLFMGKPVISTDLPEIRGYPNVHIAGSAEHFGRLCADVNGTETRPERFIMANSWAHRADHLVKLSAQQQISLVVSGEASAEGVRRLFESLKLHGVAHVREVVWLCGGFESKLAAELSQGGPKLVTVAERANTLMHAWDLAKAHCAGNVVGFIDVGQWFTSRGVFDEAQVLLHQRATIGAVGVGAGWLTRGTLETHSLEGRAAKAHTTYRQQGYRTDVAFLQKTGLFVRRPLLDGLKVEGPAWDGSTFEMAEVSFQLRELGFELAWRDLTGLRPGAAKTEPVATSEQTEQFTSRWQHRADLFLGRPPA